jgi:hypothetical protein
MNIRGKEDAADRSQILYASHFRNHLTGHQTLQDGGMEPSLRILSHKTIIRYVEA